jgi:hypothetical protein
MNNSIKYFYTILCLIFIIIIILFLIKDIIMHNNEKNIEERFRGSGNNMGSRGFYGSGGFHTQRNINMNRGYPRPQGGHFYNKNNGWRHHSSNFYRPFFYSAPMWWWNNGNNDGSYYDNYPVENNYNFYDIRQSDDNNYQDS